MENSEILTKIIKRNHSEEKFDPQKITLAIQKAGEATGEFNADMAQKLTLRVLNLSQQLFVDRYPSVEEVQDIVEEVLISSP